MNVKSRLIQLTQLNTFDRIRDQFTLLFGPTTEPLSEEVLAVNDNIRSFARYSRHFASLENSFMKLPSGYRFPFAMTRSLTFPIHGLSLSFIESHIPAFPPAD